MQGYLGYLSCRVLHLYLKSISILLLLFYKCQLGQVVWQFFEVFYILTEYGGFSQNSQKAS